MSFRFPMRIGWLTFLLLSLMAGLVGCERRDQRGASDEGDSAPTPQVALEWVTTEGQRFVDSQGGELLLRGVVTITHYNRGQPVSYDPASYRRMKAMGISYQSIRLYGAAVGATGGAASDAYLAQIDQMIADAAAAGLYSSLKLTVYDTTGGRVAGFDEAQWANFWQDESAQGQWIEGWATLWERYKENPAVVGYDLLNEPKQGDLNVSPEAFQGDYLLPFYRRAIERLRTIDDRHLLFVQPALVTFDARNDRVIYEAIEGSTSDLPSRGVVYAPHFYPALQSYETTNYDSQMADYAATAAQMGVPLLIGEFGLPWSSSYDRDEERQRAFQATEQQTHLLFDQYLIGYSRPWYADDRASLGRLNWSLFPGRRGTDGEPRPWIADPLASPYPFRTAGRLTGLQFDFDSKQAELSYEADPARGTTELVIPLDPYYTNGFILERDDGLVVRVRAAAEAEITGGGDPESVRWDGAMGRLYITERAATTLSITIRPLNE
ncbi:MAG: cellulase family glycosylhydrolase [Anaerolineales bacterium]|nr:cellulase family glycosylhydrolase [Anaerolineales bacterium]MCB9128414.1 cellulase family glycosylhydrolase [Ardenticatenales bacterium]